MHLLYFSMIVAVSFFLLPSAVSGENQPHIGIMLSKTCIIMHEQNITTTCPTYEDLLQFDSSIPQISGGFKYDDSGLLYRETPRMTNTYNHFLYDGQPRVFVDPPHMTAIPLITIHPNLDTYMVKGDMYRGPEKFETDVYSHWTNSTHTVTEFNNTSYLVLYHDMYVEKCFYAHINADSWKTVIPETISYMQNNCPEQTIYNEPELVPLHRTEFDITETRKYQHESWIDYVKKNCIFEYGKC